MVRWEILVAVATSAPEHIIKLLGPQRKLPKSDYMCGKLYIHLYSPKW